MSFTRLLDMNMTEEEILAGMHEKCRYNIRLAEKRGVQIQSVKLSEENLTVWMNLLTITTERDGFHGNSRAYYEAFIRNIQKSES